MVIESADPLCGQTYRIALTSRVYRTAEIRGSCKFGQTPRKNNASAYFAGNFSHARRAYPRIYKANGASLYLPRIWDRIWDFARFRPAFGDIWPPRNLRTTYPISGDLFFPLPSPPPRSNLTNDISERGIFARKRILFLAPDRATRFRAISYECNIMNNIRCGF